MRRTLREIGLFCALTALLIAAAQPALARPHPQAEGTPEALDVFFDGVLADQMARYSIPGAVVSVVHDGEIAFTGGYGYANLEEGRPMDPETTRVRPGSVSKLLTWTAVMQLVEAGVLDLHTDVNTYLEAFQIPDTYPEPITLWHLMTHTAGFEGRIVGIGAESPDDLLPLGEYLAARMPARVRPPGELAAYSNYGASLAGYIAAQASGLPFAAAVEAQIFTPLSMDRSTFEQLPDGTPALAEGYRYQGGAYVPVGFELIQGSPAGALSTTAVDMARFMIAHLEGGAGILGGDSIRTMHARQFGHAPEVTGWTLGFMEYRANGVRGIWHGGDMIGFHSGLWLLPEQGVGVFVCYNGPDGTAARKELMRAFMETYYPGAGESIAEGGAEGDAARFAGEYLLSAGVETRFTKLVQLVNRANVQPMGDGTLRMSGAGLDGSRWVQVAPQIFRNPSNLLDVERAVFAEDETGEIAHLYLEDDPTFALIRAPWHARAGLHVLTLGLTLALGLGALVGWPIADIRDRAAAEARPRRARRARRSAWTLSAAVLVLVVGLLVLMSDLQGLIPGMPPVGRALLTLPWLIAALAVVTAVYAVLAWVHKDWGLGARIHYSALALSGVLFTLWMIYWNVLGF